MLRPTTLPLRSSFQPRSRSGYNSTMRAWVILFEWNKFVWPGPYPRRLPGASALAFAALVLNPSGIAEEALSPLATNLDNQRDSALRSIRLSIGQRRAQFENGAIRRRQDRLPRAVLRLPRGGRHGKMREHDRVAMRKA